MIPKLAVFGAAGRMGMRIISLAVEGGEFDVVSAIERKDHPDIGKDVGLRAGIGAINVKLTSEPLVQADVVIDFSLPDSAEKTIDYCLANEASLVLGTTGLSQEQKTKLKTASEKIAVIYGTNMSVGMNVLFALVGKAAAMLGDEYDVEIIEQHHKFKKDAPSGSALTLAENISEALGLNFPDCLMNGRKGKNALRKKGEIGMHSVRAGDITGVHSVIFAAMGESLTLNHTAQNRDNFARGALLAAKWLLSKEKGAYSMADCLDIK